MQYVAIRLFGDGAMKRHKDTMELETTTLGEFESMKEAISQACLQLKCNHIGHGMLSEGEGRGGFMVVDTQELAAI